MEKKKDYVTPKTVVASLAAVALCLLSVFFYLLTV